MDNTPDEKCSPDECGFIGDCADDRNCPLNTRESEAPADKEIVALYHTYHGHDGPVLALAISPDGRTALSGSTDMTVRLWDLEKGSVSHKFEGHVNEVSAVAFAGGDTAVSGGWDNTLRIWDLKAGARKRIIRGFDFYVRTVAVSADGTMLLPVVAIRP